MVNIMLKDRQLVDMSAKLCLEEEKTFEIMTPFSFSVKFQEDNSECLATLQQSVYGKECKEEFNISITVTGEFDCEGISTDEDKAQAHIQAYCQLFPYVQLSILNVTVAVGLAPLVIEREKLDLSQIKFSD